MRFLNLVKVVSELKANQRVYYLLGLILIAELVLILFALSQTI
jgi:hypothetical protein